MRNVRGLIKGVHQEITWSEAVTNNCNSYPQK